MSARAGIQTGNKKSRRMCAWILHYLTAKIEWCIAVTDLWIQMPSSGLDRTCTNSIEGFPKRVNSRAG